MKKIFILLGFSILIVLSACKKNESPPASDTNFNFAGLSAQDTVIKVNGITSITANATGDELSYHWSATYGTFIGNGQTVKWTVCHADRFQITCEVSDKYKNVETRQVYINVQN
jgi:hypothetical protein